MSSLCSWQYKFCRVVSLDWETFLCIAPGVAERALASVVSVFGVLSYSFRDHHGAPRQQRVWDEGVQPPEPAAQQQPAGAQPARGAQPRRRTHPAPLPSPSPQLQRLPQLRTLFPLLLQLMPLVNSRSILLPWPFSYTIR
jgi:hypothetical protein